jgi:1-phosphofructokinase
MSASVDSRGAPLDAAAAAPVVTVTPNPSLDHTVEVSVLERGEVQRTSSALVQAGGKGVNVARVLAKHGHPATAILPAGDDAQRMVGLLSPQQVSTVPVRIDGAIRTNIAVVEADGTTTKLNEPGAHLTPENVEALLEAVDEQATAQLSAGGWLVAAGSLPSGAPDDFYASIARTAVAAGIPVAIDTSGPALAAAVDGGATVIKPNLEELEEILGRDLVTVGDVIDAAADLRARGSKDLLVSMGGHGALLITEEGSWWAGGPPLVPRSTVGAGDCTLSGYLHTVGTPAQRLAGAVAWGRAACLLPGSTVPGPEETQASAGAVRVVADPDPLQPVKDVAS